MTSLRHSVTAPLIGVLTLGAILAAGNATRVTAAETENGIALMIVYDTSGSMLQKVRDAEGKQTQKQVIAARALSSVIDRLEAVSSSKGDEPLPLHAGMLIFHGDHSDFAVRFGAFDPKPYRKWLKDQRAPQAGTPLGDSVRLAGETLLKSKLPRKHILVITDGINTKGPDPSVTLPKVQQAAVKAGALVSTHFVAFDVNAAEFNAVKKLGATVVGASDETQLNSQLEFILEKKILLEDEEPPPVKKQAN